MDTVFFVILARLTNDSDILKMLLLGMTGWTAFLSSLQSVVGIVVPLITCGCVIYMAYKKGKLINRELEREGITNGRAKKELDE